LVFFALLGSLRGEGWGERKAQATKESSHLCVRRVGKKVLGSQSCVLQGFFYAKIFGALLVFFFFFWHNFKLLATFPLCCSFVVGVVVAFHLLFN
jgi:hypothetical protein